MNTSKGAIITQVEKDSPADIAGIKVGDVVTKINNRVVENASAMIYKIGLLKFNTEITIQLNRKGKTITTNVKILEPKISKKMESKLMRGYKG